MRAPVVSFVDLVRVFGLLVSPLSSNLGHMLHVCILARVLVFPLLDGRVSNLDRERVRTGNCVETSPS